MAIQIISSDGSIITQQLDSCTWDLSVQIDTNNNLLYGGVVTWLQDYDFYVSPAGYFINGGFYESPEAFVTLSPADPVLDRFDVFYVDADQVVKVREGDPSLTPAQPGLDLGLELGLTAVLVKAGTTQPVGAIEECGYVDGAEWAPTASDASIDVLSPNTPCSGAASIEGTIVTAGDYFKLTRSTPVILSPDFTGMHFLIRSKGAWGNRQLNIQWYSLGLPVGLPVAFKNNTYNFTSSNVVDCQLITIDILDFSVPFNQVVDELRFTMSGNSNIGFFIDNICIQNNGGVVFPGDNDIHNQYFGPQTPGDFWILGTGRADGWFTSPGTDGGGSEKFGLLSSTTGTTATAIGYLAQANGQGGAVAVGNQAVSNLGVAIGFNAQSNAGVAIGGVQTGPGGVAVGGGSQSLSASGIALGGNSTSTSPSGIALGYFANAGPGYGATAIGTGAIAPYQYSAAFGTWAVTTAQRQLVFGGNDPYSNFGYDSLYFGSGVTSIFNTNKFWTITGSDGTDVAGDPWTFAGAKGTGAGLTGPIYWQTADPTTTGSTLQSLSTKFGLNSNTLGLYLANTRFQMTEGPDVIAVTNLTLGTGNSFTVNGNVEITAINATNWQDGVIIYLLFTGTPNIKHNTTGGVGTLPIRLAGAVDFTVTNNTVLSLQLKDGYWREIGRTQASAIGPYTFFNGLHEDLGGLVKLGGPLTEATTITLGANNLILNENGAGNIKLQSLSNVATTNILFYDPVTGNITYDDPSVLSGISADNALTMSTATNVQWGATSAGAFSPLLHTTYVNTGGFTTIFTGANTSDILTVTNTSTGSALAANSTSGNAVFGIATTGVGGQFNNATVANAALQSFNSGGGLAANLNITDASDSSVLPTLRIGRGSSATPLNGIGAAFEFGVSTSTTAFQLSNTISSLWTDATHATRTSQWIVAGVNNAVTADLLTLSGSGALKMNKYGVGSFTSGTATYLIATDIAGNWFEYPAGGIGGGGGLLVSADNGLSTNIPTNVQLFGPVGTPATLLNDRYLTAGQYTLNITGDSLAGASLLNITSNSIAAASSLQKVVNVSLSGANSTNGEITYGVYVSNVHTADATSQNYGIYSVANGSGGTANTAIYGQTVAGASIHGVTTGSGGYAVLGQGNSTGTTGSTVAGFNTTSGNGVYGESVTGSGVRGFSINGDGGYFISLNGAGVYGQSTASYAGYFQLSFSASAGDATVQPIIKIERLNSASVGNGVGESVDFFLKTSDTLSYLSNQIISKFTNVTTGTRTSQFIITGVNSAATADLFTLSGSGALKLNKYGVGNFTGTPAYDLKVDSSGNVIEKASQPIISKGLFVEYPNNAESIGMWQTPVAITVSNVKAVLVGSGSPSVTMNIAFGTDRTSGTNVFTSGQTATSTTTGHTFNSGFNDATIPAGSFIWFTTSAQSGTLVQQIELTLNYTED